MCAVRKGDWKLHSRIFNGFGLVGNEYRMKFKEVYNFRNDIGEEYNIADKNPDIVRDLIILIDKCRNDLGDEYRGIVGKNVRPVGQVENPMPLTEYNENHQYIISIYDRIDFG